MCGADAGYLENKRMVFPRLYFVSDAHLLELLAAGKDFDAVQRHLRSCFDNLTALVVAPPLPPAEPELRDISQEGSEASVGSGSPDEPADILQESEDGSVGFC
ncbi:dynein heavy chain, N-terminal region 2-domain-containing protein [Baffinella frigidus]|nr:dynein heavy chain, N-terminal region 2-domain-containing protein [Cryptophyta sp. CCMP2293]